MIANSLPNQKPYRAAPLPRRPIATLGYRSSCRLDKARVRRRCDDEIVQLGATRRVYDELEVDITVEAKLRQDAGVAWLGAVDHPSRLVDPLWGRSMAGRHARGYRIGDAGAG
jgi:hypothetical protein